MKKLGIFLASITLMAGLTGCGGSKEEAAKTSDSSVRLGFTIYKYDDNFMALVRQSIEKAGGNFDNVEILMNDSQNDQSRQNDQIDVLLSKGVNALAVNLVDPAAAGTIIAKAKADNVPVVFYNKEPSAADLASYDQAYYVGTESKEAGIIQGDLIAKHWEANPEWDTNGDGKIQYVLLKGEPGHPDAEARTEYVTKTLNENHGIATEELHMDTAMWDTAQAKDKTEAWLSGPNGEKIEMVIANNDGMALGAVEALRANGKGDIPVYGIDALSEVLVMVESGEMAGTVLNDAVNQGQATFDLSYNLATGNEAVEGTEWELVNKAVRVPYVGVDTENLKDFK